MFAIWEEGTSMQENLSQKILDLLDSGRFLTLKEIAKLLKMPEKPVEETLLHLVRLQKMNRRHFAGRDYFQTTQPQQATSKLSTVADDYLDQRQAAHALGVARTCYHHLAGKAGVALFDQLLAKKMLVLTAPNVYQLTEKGRHAFAQFLGRPVHQLNIQTCIDFSERRVHLAGKLGNDVMAKLVAEHQLALTQNRRVQVTQPIKIQPLEVRYAG